MLLDVFSSHCPYCGEPIEIALDYSAGIQCYFEDCQVCCRPMLIALEIDPADESVACTIKRDDE